MLSFGCRLFLRNARPGTTSRHRARCESCDEYLTLIEQTAASDRRLPADLGRRLRAISTRNLVVPLERERPLPATLGRSLRAILAPRPRLVPAFVGSPLYSIAASYVLVVAIGLGWGNPYDLLEPAVTNLTTSAAAALERSGGVVSSWLSTAQAEVAETERSARRLGKKIANELGAVLEPISTQGDNHGNRQR